MMIKPVSALQASVDEGRLVTDAQILDVLKRIEEAYMSEDSQASQVETRSSGSGSSSGVAESGERRGGPEDLSAVPPCGHNAWLRVRNLRRNPGVRLRCHVCGAKWHTRMSFHEKCTKFYSGTCNGSCGRPHVYARGLEPAAVEEDGTVVPTSQVTLRSLKKQRMKKRAAQEGEGSLDEAASSTSRQ